MIYIFLAILSSTSSFVIFRLAQNYSCKLSGSITLNYLVAALLGFGFLMQFNTGLLSGSKSWLTFGILLGILLIVMFYLIGNSSQKAVITVTTLTNKLSLVFPVLFSLVYFNEQISPIKYISLIISIFNKKMNWAGFHSPAVILGALLGLLNFGSFYFFIGALNKCNLNSSLVFAVVNIYFQL